MDSFSAHFLNSILLNVNFIVFFSISIWFVIFFYFLIIQQFPSSIISLLLFLLSFSLCLVSLHCLSSQGNELIIFICNLVVSHVDETQNVFLSQCLVNFFFHFFHHLHLVSRFSALEAWISNQNRFQRLYLFMRPMFPRQ